jgi:hypothetical protein
MEETDGGRSGDSYRHAPESCRDVVVLAGPVHEPKALERADPAIYTEFPHGTYELKAVARASTAELGATLGKKSLEFPKRRQASPEW